jgi:hypothetical protein
MGSDSARSAGHGAGREAGDGLIDLPSLAQPLDPATESERVGVLGLWRWLQMLFAVRSTDPASPVAPLPDLLGLISVEPHTRPEPRLTVPEARTALPAIDRALPTLGLFGRIVGRHWTRYKVAVLKDLQGHGAGRWRINEIKHAVWWMEGSSVTDLVGDLRDAGALIYEPTRGYYRMSGEARVVVAVLEALTVPEVEPRRLIKFLAAAINLGLAGGAGSDVVVGGFRAAVSVLREDLEELIQLADDGSYNALLEAADVVREHVDDMEKLLQEHERFRVEHSADSDFMALEHEALDLCAKLGDRAARVISALTDKADELMRGGARLDRGDIREFIGQSDGVTLSGILDGLVTSPPYVPYISVTSAFEALLEKAGHVAYVAPPLPKPERLVRHEPEPIPDPIAEMEAELWALSAVTPLADLVVAESWASSTNRYGTLMETVARRGRRLPPISFSDGVDEPKRGGVWRISKSTVRGGTHAPDA